MPQLRFFPIPQPKALGLLALALLGAAPQAARAGDAPDPGGLRDASITVVAGYIQGTFKAHNASFGESQQTDNGHANLNLDYDSHEKAFVRKPMGVGEFIMGWNFNATVSTFQVNKQLMSRANNGAIFLHCLPAHRGEEITDEVLDGAQSVVLEQVLNGVKVRMAILATLLGGKR